jgi:hypothetical protein
VSFYEGTGEILANQQGRWESVANCVPHLLIHYVKTLIYIRFVLLDFDTDDTVDKSPEAELSLLRIWKLLYHLNS